MKERLTISLIGLVFLIGVVPYTRGEETGPEVLISRARAVFLSPHFSSEKITRALGDALQAALLVLPKTVQNNETRSRIEGVKTAVEKGETFSDKIYGELGLAFKSVSSGKAWKLPEELSARGRVNGAIEQAVKVCAKLLDSAEAAYKAGLYEESVRHLLGMVMLVITPVERTR